MSCLDMMPTPVIISCDQRGVLLKTKVTSESEMNQKVSPSELLVLCENKFAYF